ncbi:AI-2E family transporter [Acrocarpospora phusangensis]|uniref:AI-2E family transporter n=1 Tax=Acrocarpospora phusangensis TaxID=1070424 RepID=A0A919Q8F3_9ACTN|nr:AI-2E family transporter [Acrocarpospora phusangensis]GIH24116.1 AI-2E family transporter [Acrocarpospora phusangensis]
MKPATAESGGALYRASLTAKQILILIALTAVILWVLYQVRTVAISAVFAVFFTALMYPPARWLRARGVNRTLSTLLVVLGGLALFAGFIALLVPPTVSGFGQLGESVDKAVADLQTFAASLGLDQARLDELIAQARTFLQERGQMIATGALTGVTIAGEIVIGAVLAVILAIYLVHSGDVLLRWLADLSPRASRPHIVTTSRVVFDVVGRYIRGVAAVGFVDGFFIGLALWLLGVPIALPLAVLTFLGAFLPVVGAFLAGLLAAVVAFVAKGWLVAVIVIAVVILIQQLEGHVLAPMIYGKALDLPGAVILVALAVGSVVAGIVGAFLAAPVTSVAVALIRSAQGRSPDSGPPATPPETPKPPPPAPAPAPA